MGSVNSLSDTSSEVASLGISQIMKPASEWNFNAVGAMNQPTDSEVFRFLDLPRELRDKIYRNLLIHHKPVQLKRSKLYEIGKRGRYCDLGLNIYSHLVKSIQLDTFRPEFIHGLEEYTSASRQSMLTENARLSMQSEQWAINDIFTQFLGNLKKLRFNLPQMLEILTEDNKDSLLEAKRYAPKFATIEFCGATSDIVLQLMTAWSKHVPKEIEYPKRDPQPFNPLQWSEKQAKEQKRDEYKPLLSPPVSVRPVRIARFKRPSPDGCPGEELQGSKKQKFDDEVLCDDLSPLGCLLEQIGKDGLKIRTEAQLRASDETGLTAEERTPVSKEKILAKEKTALEKKRLAIEKEGLALEKKRLAIEKEGLTLEKKKLALENERLDLEKRNLALKDEKIPPSPASTVSM